MAGLEKSNEPLKTEMRTESLLGRTQQVFFSLDSSNEKMAQPFAYDVDLSKTAEIDADSLNTRQINSKIKHLLTEGHGAITIKNPGAKHSIGVGILNRLTLTIEGSLGYFGLGLLDGPNVIVEGRVGWSCGENMMSGTVLIKKNAGSTFGAAIRGGDLVCRGDVGARTGIDQKGGTIIAGGNTGAFSGFMMQRGRMVILGDAGANLGDSMYDGTIYVGGRIKSLGADAVENEVTNADEKWLTEKLKLYGLEDRLNLSTIKKVVSGKQLWNYDSLEPSEKKLVL